MPELQNQVIRDTGPTVSLKNARNERPPKHDHNVVDCFDTPENRYHLIVENTNEAIMVFQDGLLKFFNKKALEMAGYSADSDYADKPFTNFLHPDFHYLVTDRHKRRMQGDDVPGFYQVKILHKDGSSRWLQLNVIRTIWQERPASLAFILDVTGQKRAEHELLSHYTHLENLVRQRTEELFQTRQQLQQARQLEAIGTMAAGIAHDFNNILNSIFGYIEMLLLLVPTEGKIRRNVVGISNAARRATRLIRQILTISRQTEQAKKPIRLQPLVAETLKLLQATLSADIDIRQDICSKCGIILADPTQIHQLLSNLFTNASHAMQDRGGSLTVQLRENVIGPELSRNHPELRPGTYATLTIADTGSGMTKEIAERIFDPYFTTKKLSQGSGLGLAITQAIVKNHKGAILVDSVPDKGTVFTVYLPLASKEFQHLVREETPRDAAKTAYKKILYVDDEKTTVEIWTNTLEQAGFQVAGFSDPLDALQSFRKNPGGYDVVITDQRMPGIDGTELAQELLAIRPDIPVILATGWSDSVSAQQVKKIGIRKVLNKPHRMHDLIEALGEC